MLNIKHKNNSFIFINEGSNISLEYEQINDTQVLKKLIDSLYETGGWMVWMMHTSDSVRYNSEVPNILGEVIDYCKELNIPIVTAEYGFNNFER